MTNAISFVTPIEPAPAVDPAPAPAEPPREAPARLSGQAPDLRLVIEEAEDGVGYVYKTLDRRTGEVVQVLPREDVAKMRNDPSYQPGDVIDQRT